MPMLEGRPALSGRPLAKAQQRQNRTALATSGLDVSAAAQLHGSRLCFGPRTRVTYMCRHIYIHIYATLQICSGLSLLWLAVYIMYTFFLTTCVRDMRVAARVCACQFMRCMSYTCSAMRQASRNWPRPVAQRRQPIFLPTLALAWRAALFRPNRSLPVWAARTWEPRGGRRGAIDASDDHNLIGGR